MLSEASQDEFALLVNGKKRDGYWLELGGGPPEDYSNTYKLETQYNWSGVTIDYNVKYAEMYKDKRPRTIGVFGVNCVSLNYLVLSEMTKLPKHINYLTRVLNAKLFTNFFHTHYGRFITKTGRFVNQHFFTY